MGMHLISLGFSGGGSTGVCGSCSSAEGGIVAAAPPVERFRKARGRRPTERGRARYRSNERALGRGDRGAASGARRGRRGHLNHPSQDYAPLGYAITNVALDFDVRCRVRDPANKPNHSQVQADETFVTSKLKIEPATGGPLVLDGEDLRLVSIELDGKPIPEAEYELGEETLTIAAPPAGAFELKTVVAIKPKENTQLSGLYETSGNMCTQCEAEGFRRITYMCDAAREWRLDERRGAPMPRRASREVVSEFERNTFPSLGTTGPTAWPPTRAAWRPTRPSTPSY